MYCIHSGKVTDAHNVYLLNNLANVAGYEVDFTNVSDKEMIIASAESFAKEYIKLNALFERITVPISKEEQRNAIATFFGKNNKLI